MDKIQDELNVYKIVAGMTGSILYRYGIKTDTMELFFGRADLSKYGSFVNDYVQMIQRQRAANPEIDADNFIYALKEGKSYFECKSRISDFMGTVKSYTIIGKTLYDDDNEPSYVVGKMSEIRETDQIALKMGKDDDCTDKLTGLYNKRGIKNKLEAKCIEKNGAEGALLDIVIDNLKASAFVDSQMTVDNIAINIAQFIKRFFPYDVYIGRMRQNEFNIIYYGDDVKDRFLLRLNELRESIEEVLVNEEGKKLTVKGGLYYGPFSEGEGYEIREKAYMALLSAKHHDGNQIIMYTNDLENPKLGEERENVSKTLDDVQFDHHLVEKALEIISSSGNVEEAVGLIFRRVARKYGIDRIVVRELNSDNRTVDISYEWMSSTFVSGVIDRSRQEDYDVLERIYANEDIIIVPDTAKWQPEDDEELRLATAGLKSFVQCVFSVSNRISGCVAFECYDNKHNWSDGEIKTLKLITQLVSSYLITVREYKEMLSEKESYETHDTLTGFYKYDAFVKEAEKYVNLDKTGKFAIVYSGIKQLMSINGRYGYDVGDAVLKGYAEIMSAPKDRFIMGCRVNADNFIILVNVFDSRGNRISTTSITTLSSTFYEKYGDICPGIDISVDAGISIINDRSLSIEQYIDKALDARGRARNSGYDGLVAD